MLRSCKRCDRLLAGNTVFCTNYCSAKYNNEVRQNRVPYPCLQCGTETINAKFCSSKCVGESQRRPINRKKSIKKQVARVHPLSAEERQTILARQKGLCAICKIKEARVVDHCHATGKIRGLLCYPCNTAIGALGDTSKGVLRAVKYLKKSEK